MAGRLDAVRAFLRELAAAVPTLPDELGRAWRRSSRDQERAVSVSSLACFAASASAWNGCSGGQRRVPRALDRQAARDHARPPGRSGGAPLRSWRPARLRHRQHRRLPAVRMATVLKQMVLAYLLVFLIVRLVLVLGRFLLAPGAERFRIIPMATPSAGSGSSGRRSWSAGSFVKTPSTCLRRSASRARGRPRGPGVRRGRRARPVRGVAPSGAGRASRRAPWARSWLLCSTWSSLAAAVHRLDDAVYVGVILLLLPMRCGAIAVGHVLRPAGQPVPTAVPSVGAVRSSGACAPRS